MLRTRLLAAFLLSAAALCAQPQYFTASLTGGQEVPPNNSTAIGKALLVLSGTNLTIQVTTSAFASTASAGHIHKGAVGATGGVVIPFVNNSSTSWSATTTVTVAQIADLQNGLWYANIHTASFPAGEIRGQVAPATAPSTFGAGCVGSNAQTPSIAARDFAAIGMTFQVSLAGAKPSSQALLFLGDSNTNFGGIPLPFNLTGLGMTNCTMLCSDFGLGLVAPTSATGTAALGLPVPLSFGLLGAQLYSQWYPLDPAANPLGFTASNGLSFKLQ